MSQQLHCRGMRKILLWSVEYILKKGIVYFGRILIWSKYSQWDWRQIQQVQFIDALHQN